MEAELLQLAQEATAALQAANQPNWTEVAGAVVGFLQVGLIAWGLRLMGKASDARNRQLDVMEAAQLRQGDALERQGEVLAELLRRRA